jgi:hypothetical protein
MIWLLTHLLLPLSRQQVASLFSVFLCITGGPATDRKRGGGDGLELNHTTAKNLALYTSLNTLWCFLFSEPEPEFANV